MEYFAGLGLAGLVIAVVITILPWIAIMCIWSNTGKTANYCEKMYNELLRRNQEVIKQTTPTK